MLARAGARKQQVQKPQEVGQAGWEENDADAPAQVNWPGLVGGDKHHCSLFIIGA